MTHGTISRLCFCERRQFLRAGVGAACATLVGASLQLHGADRPESASLAFAGDDSQFLFDTGAFRGVLRQQGRSLGLMPLTDTATARPIARGYGVCSHYRLLDTETRYGHGAWDWPSTARLLGDGSVEVVWSADDQRPLDTKSVYRWTDPRTLDLTTAVTARRDLARLEVFLASYFDGFPAAYVYVKRGPRSEDQTTFLEARRELGAWQMYPRDEAAVKVIQDGRWQRPPNPVDWQILPELAAPLAMRRDAESGLAALIMAPPDDCFAIATPYGEEGHRSLYLSLIGRDVKSGETSTAKSRLVIARDVTDEQAIGLYRAYQRQW